MRNTIILAALVACIAMECVNAQFPKRRRKAPSDIYKWSVDVDSGTLASQKAVSLQSRDAIFLFTYGKDMKQMNISHSSMLMEYSDPAGVMAVRFGSRKKGICFLIPISETVTQIKNDLVTRNGTTITLPDTVAYNATGDPLSKEEADAVFQQHPTIKPFCYRAPIVEATDMTLGDEDPDTKTVTMLAWDSRVALMVRTGAKPADGSGDEDKPKRRWPKFPRRGPLFPRRRG